VNQQEMEARIKELEKQVSVLRDIEDIQRLQKSYGFYLEHWLYEDLINLFADDPDTTLNIMAGIYLGKEGVRRYFSSLKHLAENPEFLHQIMQLSGIVDVAVDGQTAQGRFFGFGCAAVPMGGGVKPLACNGIYTAEYIKEGGVWKILKLTWNPLFMSAPQQGWVKQERIDAVSGKSIVSASAKPDKPRDTNPVYPTGYVVPFHFKHPVTGKKSTEDQRNALIKEKAEARKKE
jgi:hypothetical protein